MQIFFGIEKHKFGAFQRRIGRHRVTHGYDFRHFYTSVTHKTFSNVVKSAPGQRIARDEKIEIGIKISKLFFPHQFFLLKKASRGVAVGDFFKPTKAILTFLNSEFCIFPMNFVAFTKKQRDY